MEPMTHPDSKDFDAWFKRLSQCPRLPPEATKSGKY
jgi:hypothetical protein